MPMDLSNLAQPGAAAAAPTPTRPVAADQTTPAAQASGPDAEVSLPEELSGEPIRLHRVFATLQEKLSKLADGLGVRRSVTVPFTHGGAAHEHISAVGLALQPHGGLGENILTSFHHTGGRGFGSGDGSTQAWRADKLRETIIGKDDPNAIASLASARSLINKVAALVGKDDQSVVVASSQLAMLAKYKMQGMNLADAMFALTSLTNPILQKVAQLHSSAKHGAHHPALTAPQPDLGQNS